jgi:hypothetical protein
MSINSLTEAEVRRRVTQHNAALAAAGAVAGQAQANDNPVNNALSMLVKYIPTESITLYVAAISAASALKSVSPKVTEGAIYWFFAVLTPVLLLLIYLGKRKVAGLPTFPPIREWPWWKTFAATVAFLVWALAVPGNPYVKGDTAGAAVAGFFAIFISTILSILEPIFDPAPDG